MAVRCPRRGEIVRIRDERWVVCGQVAHESGAIVDVRGCDRTNRGLRTRFLLPFEPFHELPATSATQVVGRRRWRHLARQILGSAAHAYDSLRSLARARIDIFPFQLEPALAVVRGAASRILMADEVGLGKTVQAGLIISEALARSAQARALVICPAALRLQWRHELENRFGLQPVLLDSTALSRPRTRLLRGANPWSAHSLIVASLDYVKRPDVLRGLEDLVWDVVVIDEAHGVAGRSDRRAAAGLLGERARTLVMLTATPHSGDERAFRRLCGIGSFTDRFPLAVFRRTRQDVGLRSSRRSRWLNVGLSPAEHAMHRALVEYASLVWRHNRHAGSAARLAMIVLLRRACSSAASLAGSVERRLLLLNGVAADTFQLDLPFGGDGADDEEPAMELGAPGLANREVERAMLENVLRLASRAHRAESKLQAIRRLLRRTADRAIVFTEYRDTLMALAAGLAAFDCVVLHGGLAAAEREQVLQRFVAGQTRVLLATDAASEGLNLQQGCRLVINLEVPWTPLRLEQRIGRVDRIGQRRRVHQLLLVAAGTEEQSTIAALVRRRAARVNQALSAMRRPSLDEHDIANRILGVDSTPAGDADEVDLPEGLITVDLRRRAAEEAERAAIARAFTSSKADSEVAIRPFAAAVHPRASRGYSAFRLCIPDADDVVLWDILVGLAYVIENPRFHDQAQVLEHVRRSREALRADLLRAGDLFLERDAQMLESATTLAISREEAIVAQLERRHARLAASLLQPALFGRHTERDTSAQQAVIQDALNRCREHQIRLARQRHPAARVVEPVFTVILR
jgi:superfamily II DNA or RNA helicase